MKPADFGDQAQFWDERYANEVYIFGTRPNAFLASQAARFTPGMSALVPGDGEGRNSVWLAQQGLEVDAVDISAKGIAKAKALAAQAGVAVRFTQADLLTWDWPVARYDIVAAIYVHFFDGDRPAMHRAMLRALKPGGLLLLEAYNLCQLDLQKQHHSGGPKTADMLYSAEKLAADFERQQVELLEECEVDLDEGHRHKGRAAVVRAIVPARLRGEGEHRTAEDGSRSGDLRGGAGAGKISECAPPASATA
jgi:SAM-dependent methyltransferase